MARTHCGGLTTWAYGVLMGLVFAAVAGCGGGPKLAPLKGKVTFEGEPLKFGSVMLQPPQGQPATGRIQSDGTFVFTTNREGDGATVGPNKIRVTHFEGQDPSVQRPEGAEPALGKTLIPEHYTNYETSGLSFDVKEGNNEDLILELKK